MSGSRHCEPVFSNIASCAEIPDAIGWSSCYSWRGSTVIECKTSTSDFHADKRKYLVYQDQENGRTFPAWRITQTEANAKGYKEIWLPRMGDFRYFMCEPGVLTEELVAKHAPDHGLIYMLNLSRVKVIRHGPQRELVDKDGEIRYLRFAIINRKPAFAIDGEPNGVPEDFSI